MVATERPTRIRWRIIALIFFVYVLMFLDRVNISIAAKYIMPEYGLSQVEFGLIFSAFVFAYALVQIPGGWLGDRFGPRRVMTWAILWWSAFTALTALAGNLALAGGVGVVTAFVIVRALVGIGEAVAPPSGNRMVANWSTEKERGLAAGIALSGSPLGAAMAPPLIVWIMTQWGWREAFYAAGAAGLVVALIWHWLTTDRPRDHPRVNAAERALLDTGDAARPATPQQATTPWRQLLGSRDLWLLSVAYAALAYNAYFYYAWFYLYLVNERGFSLTSGGFYTMAPFITMAVSAQVGGALSDRLVKRHGLRRGRSGLACLAMLATGVLVCAGAMAEDRVAAVVFLSASTGTLLLSAAAFWATTIDLAESQAGTAAGVMNMCGNLGGSISPSLTPWLAEHYGWSSALLVMGALSVLGALLWLGIDPSRRIAFTARAA